MTRGARQPAIATGIYPDVLGFEARITVKGKPYGKRFPPKTPLLVMQEWQAAERAYRLRCAIDDAALVAPPVALRGTFHEDVTRYLRTRQGRTGYKADRSHLKAWTDLFGTRPRWKISRKDCEQAISDWHVKGRSPKTLTHRVRVLRECWHHAEGRSGRTPVDKLSLPKAHRPAPVPIDHAIIQKVAASLAAGLTITKGCGPKGTKASVRVPSPAAIYARFLIYALSGQRPSQIARAQPEDIKPELGIWFVRPGKGGYTVPFPMSEQLAAAWVLFDRADAWGKFDTCGFTATLRRHGWPEHVEPYQMRHTFAIDQLLAGTSLGDLQGLLGHTDPKTTRYYAPVAVALLRQAIEKRTLKLS